MPVEFTTRDIREKYDTFARWYDLVDAPQEHLVVKRLRRRLLRRASGEVLEVAAGTGANLPHYPEAITTTVCRPTISPLRGPLGDKHCRPRMYCNPYSNLL